MRVSWNEDDVAPAAGRVVTIGAFDGVHLGHRALLRLVRELGSARGLPAAIVTFDRHPAEVVRPDAAPLLLTDIDQKLRLLSETGDVDDCLVLRFDHVRSEETAEHFVEHVLSAVLGARVVVVGADFHFGYRRRGNVALLQQMGADLGFEVLGLGLVAAPDGREAAHDAAPYTSTRVRQLLADGHVAGAADLLGRDHEIMGTAIDRGRDDPDSQSTEVAIDSRICVPGDGIYAGHARDGESSVPALISIHRRPAHPGDEARLSVGLRVLDAELDRSGQPVAVTFRDRVRDRAGGDLGALEADSRDQITADLDALRRIISDG